MAFCGSNEARQHLAKIYPSDLKARKDLQTVDKDVKCTICILLSCLIYFPTSSWKTLAIDRVCDHFNNVADQHEECNAYILKLKTRNQHFQ